MIRATPLRTLARLALFLAALYVLYLVTANALLNSDWGRRQLERAANITLSWERAWTAFPGQLRVRQLQLSGTAAEHRIALEAETATLEASLAPLLGREVRLRRLDAEGIRHVSLDEYRLQGSGRLHLAGLHWDAGTLAVRKLRLSLDDGAVLKDDTRLVEGVTLEADLTLAPLALAEATGAVAGRAVSGTVTLAGRSDAYTVFNPYLASLGWLEVGGRGDLQGEVMIESGEIQPGSRLRLDSPQLSVGLDERHWLERGARYRIEGAGSVVAEMQERTRLKVDLDGIEMADVDASPASLPLLRGDGFRLDLTAPALRLQAPYDQDLEARHVRARLRWLDTDVGDIAALDRYLPAEVPLTLEGGVARLQGELTFDGERLSGGIDLSGEALALRLGEQPLRGRLGLHLPIAELDLERGRVDISGTRLDIDAAAPGETQPLTTELRLPTARFQSPLAWRALDDAPLLGGATPWSAEVELHGRVANLGVLDPLLAPLLTGRFGGGLALEGGGRLDGTLHLRDGQPLAGSQLAVRSEALGARFLGVQARGDGRAHLTLRPDDPYPQADVTLVFNEVDLTRLADGRRLFQAEQLSLTGTASAGPQPSRLPSLTVAWHDARLPDVAVLNNYLPEAVPLRLAAGWADSRGRIMLKDDRGRGSITLAGDEVRGRLLEKDFQGELDVTLALREIDPDRQRVDLSGSRLELTASSSRGEPLHTLVVLPRARLEGSFDWPGRQAPRRPLAGTLQLDGQLDRLGFLNAFLPDEHGLGVEGGGRLSLDLDLANGEVMPESQLRVQSDRLAVRFLHYEAFGDGSLVLETADPGAQLTLSLPRFGLRRQEGSDSLIDGRLLEIRSRAQHLDPSEGLEALSTRIDMPDVAIADLAAFNDYLPKDAGIAFLSGQATMATHLRLEGLGAEGSLTLHASDARLAFDEQILKGALALEARLSDGDLETLRFDVAGSELRMSDVRLENAAGDQTRGWWARLEVPEGEMRWVAPLALDARLDLAMRDSGLLVNLFLDAARERRWLRDRLTLGEVRGEVRVMLDDDTLRLEDLAVRGGRRLELLANVALRDAHLAGRALARVGPFRLGIELDGERRRWQLRNVRDWYASGRPASEMTLPERREWFELLDAEPE
ncbi:hypothetical protein [Halomonas saccharevitans]|uniref:Uncharacterized protein n=1 Tax=Halomonas saccharevitans TaxID=416872 RepID=A0A1I7CMB8_9GAMM|nr:hypothetical protein [Halomonas saccharevitans]SFU00586.1 hypothetical protein SAMN04487956_15110 [Halomonas saccharevitans]